MKLFPYLFMFFLMSCSSREKVGTKSIQADALNGCPIIINEGQAIVFKMPNEPKLIISAAVLNGELAVWEVDPHGRNFEIVWKDSERWKTSTEFGEGEKRVTITDENGDGKADFMRIGTPAEIRNGTPSDMVGFTAKEQEWEKMDKRGLSK